MITISPVITYSGLTAWELYNGEMGMTTSPELFPMLFKKYIEKIYSNTYIYIVDLTTFRDDFIKLLSNLGFTYTDENVSLKDLPEKHAKYLIGGQNATIYDITIKYYGKKIEILDANNFFPDRDKVLKTWQKHDSQSTARAYYRAFCDLFEIVGKMKTTPMTISACSKKIFQKQSKLKLQDANNIRVGDYTLEQFCRHAYHGGFCEAKEYNQMYDKGVILDVNSLYPYVMRYYPMPCGVPEYGTGKLSKEKVRLYNAGKLYFFIHIKASFKLKPGKVPCVRTSEEQKLMFEDGWMNTSDYVNKRTGEIFHEIGGKLVLCDLYLTCTDFELFLKSYDIEMIEYIDYVTMTTSNQIFANTIDYLYEIKQNADGGRRQMAKILMNAISGNMARKSDYTNYYIKSIKDDGVNYVCDEYQGQTASYIYIGAAITSYARKIIIDSIGKYYDRWVYSDTDSLHLLGNIPDDIHISDKLGDFKVEHEFDRAVYYKHKMYGFLENGKYDFKLVGIPKSDTKELLKKINCENDSLEWYDTAICSVLDPLKRLYMVPIDVRYRFGKYFKYEYEDGQVYIDDMEDYK